MAAIEQLELLQPTERRRRRILELEGLRGLAALMVLFTHLRGTFLVDSKQRIAQALIDMPALVRRPIVALGESIFDGNFAVWVFWVMSAFVLSIRFFRTADREPLKAAGYVGDSALKRYVRLLIPVAVSGLFAYVLLRCGMMHNRQLAAVFGSDYDGWLGAQYTMAPDLLQCVKTVLWDTFFAYDAATTYNPAFWTMEKEFIGSLFLFASLLLFGSSRKRLLVYPVTAFCLTLLGLHWVTSFLAGMALCDLYVHRENNPVGNDAHWTYRTGARLLDNRAVAAMSVMAIAVLVGLPNYGKVLHLIVASMLVPLCLLSKPLRSLLSSRPVAFLGRISFGLYLVHVPLICSFSCWLYLKIGPELGRLWGSLICCAVTIPLALVAGWLLHLAGDRPGLRLASRIPALVNRITG